MITMTYLPCEIIETNSHPDKAVIWLHGLGASGHDFVPIVPMLKLTQQLAVRFVFPHAPVQPVTINGGMAMPSWYDIISMEIDRKIDQQDILRSTQSIVLLIERELARGVESKNIVIAGFSQGGAVSYQTALSYHQPLAGLLALSTYYATAKTISLSDANSEIPILICHGTDDEIVDKKMADSAKTSLEKQGYQPRLAYYTMGHEVIPQQIADIDIWLHNTLKPN